MSLPKVLDEVFDKYHQYTPSQLSRITHDSAWEKTWKEGSTKVSKMPLTSIVQEARIPKAMIGYIMDNISLSGME